MKFKQYKIKPKQRQVVVLPKGGWWKKGARWKRVPASPEVQAEAHARMESQREFKALRKKSGVGWR